MLQIEKTEFEYGSKKQIIAVRGICAADITAVLSVRKASVEILFGLADDKGIKSFEDMTAEKLLEVANAAIAEVPELVALVIAACADRFEEWQAFGKLPVSFQLKLLMEISKLTFEDGTNFGDFLGNVMAVVRMIHKSLPTPPIQTSLNQHQHNSGSVQ